MLRRWRREVMPELDAAEEAGTLEPPPPMRSQLAEKLAKLSIPLIAEQPPDTTHVRHVAHISDLIKQRPGTPEAAFAATFKEPAPTPAPTPIPTPKPTPTPAPPAQKETQMTAPAAANHVAKYTKTSLTQEMFYKLCKWIETPNILDGCWSYNDVAKRASAQLGMGVADSSIKRALDLTGAKMPDDSAVRMHKRRDRLTIVAEAVLHLYNKLGEPVPEELMTAAHPGGKA